MRGKLLLVGFVLALGGCAAAFALQGPARRTVDVTVDSVIRVAAIDGEGIGLSGRAIIETDAGAIEVRDTRAVHALEIGHRYRLHIEGERLTTSAPTLTSAARLDEIDFDDPAVEMLARLDLPQS